MIRKLLIDECQGIHIPKIFATNYAVHWNDIDENDLVILRAGANAASNDEEWSYAEAWDNVLLNAVCMDTQGRTWRLEQDGHLWAIPDLSNEELAEEIADDNNIDVDAFTAFCENENFTLTDAHEAYQAVRKFKECYYGTYSSVEEYARQYLQECYSIPATLENYVNYEHFFEDQLVDSYYALEVGNKVAIFQNM